MAQITGITPQIKDKLRCNIEVDGRFYCGMKLETVMQNRLKVGTVVTTEELSRMQLESEKQTALDKALTHISVSMKTEREIRLFLQKKGYLADVCDFVVGRMKEYGFLDDGAYARQYAENASKTKGRRLIELELKRKGVSEEDIETGLEEFPDETESAARQLEKYLRNKQISKEILQKAFRYLLTKGYGYDTARAALEKWTDDED